MIAATAERQAMSVARHAARASDVIANMAEYKRKYEPIDTPEQIDTIEPLELEHAKPVHEPTATPERDTTLNALPAPVETPEPAHVDKPLEHTADAVDGTQQSTQDATAVEPFSKLYNRFYSEGHAERMYNAGTYVDRVYHLLCNMSARTGTCHPSTGYIGRVSRIRKRNTVSSAVNWLERNGYITIQRRNGTTSVYRINKLPKATEEPVPLTGVGAVSPTEEPVPLGGVGADKDAGIPTPSNGTTTTKRNDKPVPLNGTTTCTAERYTNKTFKEQDVGTPPIPRATENEQTTVDEPDVGGEIQTLLQEFPEGIRNDRRKDVERLYRQRRRTRTLPPIDELIDVVRKQRDAWNAANRKHFPRPYGWLNGNRWEDPLPEANSNTSTVSTPKATPDVPPPTDEQLKEAREKLYRLYPERREIDEREIEKYAREQNDTAVTEEFERIWEAYPKQVAHGRALDAYKAARGNGLPPVDELLQIIKEQRLSVEWSELKKNKETQFIPNLATWIEEERYRDKLTPLIDRRMF